MLVLLPHRLPCHQVCFKISIILSSPHRSQQIVVHLAVSKHKLMTTFDRFPTSSTLQLLLTDTESFLLLLLMDLL